MHPGPPFDSLQDLCMLLTDSCGSSVSESDGSEQAYEEFWSDAHWTRSTYTKYRAPINKINNYIVSNWDSCMQEFYCSWTTMMLMVIVKDVNSYSVKKKNLCLYIVYNYISFHFCFLKVKQQFPICALKQILLLHSN